MRAYEGPATPVTLDHRRAIRSLPDRMAGGLHKIGFPS
jgi:hypothetical protein